MTTPIKPMSRKGLRAIKGCGITDKGYVAGNPDGLHEYAVEWCPWCDSCADSILLAIQSARAEAIEEMAERVAKELDDAAAQFKEAASKESHAPGNKEKAYRVSAATFSLAAETVRALLPPASTTTGECKHESYSVTGGGHVSCNYCAMELPRIQP